MSHIAQVFALCILTFFAAGCALSPYHLEDPNQLAGIAAFGPRTPDVVRSLRCEIITFIVENRLRNKLWDDTLPGITHGASEDALNDKIAFLKRYPYVPLDKKQYAALGVDLKNIDIAGVTINNDWKNVFKNSPVVRDFHIGPAITATNTYEFLPPLAIQQVADLGPAKSFDPPGAPPLPPAKRYSSIFYRQPTSDAPFYCYKSLANSRASTLVDAIEQIQTLVVNGSGSQDYANFDRVFVGPYTLAQWLQNIAADLTENSHTIFATPESLIVGQIAYTFTLDIKPAMDFKYTYMANVVNPFVPDLSASLEHSSTFSIFLNTPNALAALTAKQGNTCNASVPAVTCPVK